MQMTFREFKETEEFLMADVISFVDTNGEELDIGKEDDFDDEALQDFCIVETHSDGGYLEIVLS